MLRQKLDALARRFFGKKSEQLDYEPARFLRRRTIRRKYVHRVDPDRAPVLAPLPERVLERSVPSPGVVAHILVGKYCDHLPLYRQEQIYAQRHGVHLPRQSLARWVGLAADWLQPIYEQIRTGVLADGWAHVRRKFYEARESAPRTAGWLLRQIQHLYHIEASLRVQRTSPKGRAVVRAHQSRPVVARLERALIRLKRTGRYLPQSLLGGAIDYALGQWPTLQVYLTDGRVEIDNNLVENAIRPTAIGKKNWLVIGDAQAGAWSAIIYTVIESCRRRQLDPYRYLRDGLTRLPQMTNRQIPTVTPEAWGKQQQPLHLQPAS